MPATPRSASARPHQRPAGQQVALGISGSRLNLETWLLAIQRGPDLSPPAPRRSGTRPRSTTSGTGLVLRIETGETISGCSDCGVVAVGPGRRQARLHDIPCFGRPVWLLWAMRIRRCPDPGCPRTTFTEQYEWAGPRAKLTARAIAWATDALQRFDTSVSALAHQLTNLQLVRPIQSKRRY
jgi:hypothetical protein